MQRVGERGRGTRTPGSPEGQGRWGWGGAAFCEKGQPCVAERKNCRLHLT